MNKKLRLCLQGLACALLLGVVLFRISPAAAAEGPLAVTETPTVTETAVVPSETPTPTVTAAVATNTPTPTQTATVTPTGAVVTVTPTPTNTQPPQPQPTGVPVVNLVKSINETRVVVGSVVRYDLVVTNPNDFAIDDVTVQDALPAQVDYVSATSPVGTVSYDATTRTVTVVLGTLAAKQEVTVAIQARVNGNASSASPIVNQATITYGRTVRTSTTSNQVTAELVPGSLPATGIGAGPREIVTLSLILGMAALTALALYDRSRRPKVQEQAEIIKD